MYYDFSVMRKKALILLPVLILSACTETSINGGGSKRDFSVYLDNSEVVTEDFKIKVTSANASSSYNSDNYSFSLSLKIKNLSSKTKEVEFKNSYLVKEDTNATYSANATFYAKQTLDSEIEGSFSFSSTIPSSLDEHYYFSTSLENLTYKVYLYETPDELREDVTISYQVGDSIVHTETVKKGRELGTSYIYDNPDHQTYVHTWKDPSGSSISSKTIINEDIVVKGTIQSNLATATTGTDVFTFINGVNHVHSDGKVVILEKYQNKEVCIGNYVFYNKPEIKEIYFPKTLHQIYSFNFERCGNLKTIYFAGSETEWNLIPSSSTIPDSVQLVFGVSYSF